jgi:hypothetical protein
MTIVCGKDTLDIATIDTIYVTISEVYLCLYEEQVHGSLAFVYDYDRKNYKQRLALRDQFVSQHRGKQVLVVYFHEMPTKYYLEGECGFDVWEKEQEINQALKEFEIIRKKEKNSFNSGEKKIEHALKWINASNEKKYVSIAGDCESKYRFNCILLYNEDFIDEPQEYDHIIVCCAGVIVIETKDWQGTVEIRNDGKWIRTNPDGKFGVASPKVQMRRHEALLGSILPNVPIYSVLCFSNDSVVINGRENFKNYPIITIDELEDYITDICENARYSAEDIEAIVERIEQHKYNVK